MLFVLYFFFYFNVMRVMLEALLYWVQADRLEQLQAQKSPQGLRHAGFQDFISRLW